MEREVADRRRKAIIRVLFIIFVLVLVLTTLFSNTLQSLTLPKVRTEKLSGGSLLHTLEGSGILQPLSKENLDHAASWKVKEIRVNKGERVKKGQRLIIYDSRHAERELEDQITMLKKQNIVMKAAQEQFIASATEGDERIIRNAKREIETVKLDIEMQERKVNDLRERLPRDKELLAPFDGVIMEVNAVEGLPASGAGDVVIANIARGYQFSITVDTALLSHMELSIGVQLGVEVNPVPGKPARSMNGTVFDMEDAEPRTEPQYGNENGKTRNLPQKTIYIKVLDTGLKGGEQAAVRLEKSTNGEGLIVSNSAIHQDRNGSYVYKVEERRGALGNVFAARKVSIEVVMATADETMIQSDNLYEEDVIIVESGEPLQDGDRVRLQ